MLDGISEAQIKQYLCGIAENMGTLSRDALKNFLSNIIGRGTLDPANHICWIDYRIVTNQGIRWRPHADSTLPPDLCKLKNIIFMLETVCREAENILLEQRLFILNKTDFHAFMSAAPIKNNHALCNLMARKVPWE